MATFAAEVDRLEGDNATFLDYDPTTENLRSQIKPLRYGRILATLKLAMIL